MVPSIVSAARAYVAAKTDVLLFIIISVCIHIVPCKIIYSPLFRLIYERRSLSNNKIKHTNPARTSANDFTTAEEKNVSSVVGGVNLIKRDDLRSVSSTASIRTRILPSRFVLYL